MTRLSLAELDRIARVVSVPNYRRDQLTAGIVHFGVGNFHRAHQAVFLDALFNRGLDHEWAVVGAGVRPADVEMRRALAAQDYLSTVVEQEADQTAVRVTGVMIDMIEPGDTAAIIAKLADPAIRIVSLTITEGGYYIDPGSRRFDPTHPDIVRDAADAASPRTVFGIIVAGLRERKSRGIAPFTVMSCDNVPGNGHVTRNAVVGYARLIDPALADWIGTSVAFPGSMVDRITPATSDRERALLAEQFGIDDRWPVFCEGFRQWVLEDHFPAGRPALEKVGVQFVPDVAPFEFMKIRILNGGHATIAYPAALLDIHFVHEAMQEPLIRDFLNKVEHDEIIPVVPPVPGTDLGGYYRLIERRFANPGTGDTITRLCFDGSNRQPKFILPSVADRLGAGASIKGLALVSAFWCRYCYGETESGRPIAPNDPGWDRLTEHARRARTDPAAWLAMEDIFGPVARDARYLDAFTSALNAIWREGTASVLRTYLEPEA
jgi:mannitol 2-dehydrogenase